MTAAPVFPRLRSGLVAVQTADGMVIEGGPRSQRLAGGFANRVLPRLLPLLDGSRRLDDVAAVLPARLEQVATAIRVLAERGIVEVTAEQVRPANQTPLHAFLDRTTPPDHRDLIIRRLAAARVLVCGPHGPTSQLIRCLTDSGVGTIERDTAPRGAADLAIVVTTAPSDAAVSSGTATPTLRLQVGPGAVTVSPLLGVPGGRCPTCYDDRPPGGADPTPADVAIGLGLLAGAALKYLGGYGNPWVWRGTITIRHGRIEEQLAGRDPACLACGDPRLSLDEDALAHWRYEESVEIPVRGGDPGPMRVGEAGNGDTARRYLAHRRLPVSRPHRAGPSTWTDDLVWLLDRTFGSSRNRRTVIGGTGLVHPYVLTDPGSHGWSRCYFDSVRRELIELAGPPPTDSRHTTGSVRLLLVSDKAAITRRLGVLGQRLAHHDAGTRAVEVSRLAHRLGWTAQLSGEGPDPATYGSLELDPDRNLIVATIRLCPPGASDRTRAAAARWDRRHRATGSHGYRFGPDEVPDTLVADVLRTSRIADRELFPSAAPAVSTLVYARRVSGLPTGIYRVGDEDEAALRPWRGGQWRFSGVESWLAARRLDPAALVLCSADVPAVLGRQGAAGYSATLAAAAAAGSLVRWAAAAAGLRAGLFARLPASLPGEMAGDPTERLRVLAGVGLGRPAGPAGPDEAVLW
ncbi:hypothetical protein [Fodinicola acaciae]|uniref:hypothetical protein n=1 Tax=Fodinicola acaciae TaxID=2681555 RepID=UPI0013D14F91|nr:hypothetical protein [Fodinicola acaciae]